MTSVVGKEPLVHWRTEMDHKTRLWLLIIAMLPSVGVVVTEIFFKLEITRQFQSASVAFVWLLLFVGFAFVSWVMEDVIACKVQSEG
jgi:hypothetical protein